jgi:septum formation protein
MHPQALVLGADTTVALGDRVLNKPANLSEAKAMLRALSGKVHTVHTAICLVLKAENFEESHALTARVHFRELSEAAIEEYTQLVNTLDKAGAYGIQQGKALIIASHDEPLSLIMGLPVEFTHERLKQLGFRARLVG